MHLLRHQCPNTYVNVITTRLGPAGYLYGDATRSMLSKGRLLPGGAEVRQERQGGLNTSQFYILINNPWGASPGKGTGFSALRPLPSLAQLSQLTEIQEKISILMAKQNDREYIRKSSRIFLRCLLKLLRCSLQPVAPSLTLGCVR